MFFMCHIMTNARVLRDVCILAVQFCTHDIWNSSCVFNANFFTLWCPFIFLLRSLWHYCDIFPFRFVRDETSDFCLIAFLRLFLRLQYVALHVDGSQQQDSELQWWTLELYSIWPAYASYEKRKERDREIKNERARLKENERTVENVQLINMLDTRPVFLSVCWWSMWSINGNEITCYRQVIDTCYYLPSR